MSIEFANVTYESKTGDVLGKVTTLANGGAKIELRSQLDARSLWKMDSTHASITDACEVLDKILENC